MALADDVLLLAAGPRCTWRTRGDVRLVLAGALLVEDLLAGRPCPPRGRWTGPERWVQERAVTARDEVAARLLAAGRVRQERVTTLRVFSRTGFAVLDEAGRDAALDRLAAGFDPRPALRDPERDALAVLAAVSGLARDLLVAPADRFQAREAAAHLNALATAHGPDLTDVLLGVRRAYRRSGDGGPVVPVDPGGDEGFGDCGGDGGGGGGDGGGDGGGGGGD